MAKRMYQKTYYAGAQIREHRDGTCTVMVQNDKGDRVAVTEKIASALEVEKLWEMVRKAVDHVLR